MVRLGVGLEVGLGACLGSDALPSISWGEFIEVAANRASGVTRSCEFLLVLEGSLGRVPLVLFLEGFLGGCFVFSFLGGVCRGGCVFISSHILSYLSIPFHILFSGFFSQGFFSRVFLGGFSRGGFSCSRGCEMFCFSFFLVLALYSQICLYFQVPLHFHVALYS